MCYIICKGKPIRKNEVKNRSVQTGDETEAALMILTCMLSLGILVFMLKKKRAY